MSLVSQLTKMAEKSPDKPAFIFLGRDFHRTVLTFSEVVFLGRKFAAVLRAHGVDAGDVVCNTLPNSPERLITQVGTLMAAAVDMNGQVCRVDGSDFLRSLKDGQVKAVVYDPHDPRGAYGVLKDRVRQTSTQNKSEISCTDVPSLKLMIVCSLGMGNGMENDRSLLDDLREFPGDVCVDPGPGAVSVYLCTSGSTSLFKLVSLTSSFLVQSGYQFAEAFGLTTESVYMNDKPFGWLAGYPITTFCVGCTRVTIDHTVPRGDNFLSFYWEALKRERCSHAVLVPFLLGNLIEEAAKNPCRDGYLLERALVLGAPTTKKILSAIETIAKSLATVYGSTETCLIASHVVSSRDDYYDDFVCGTPVPGTVVKVVGENLETLTSGKVGEVLVKPAIVCSGYVNNDDAQTSTFLPGGWVRLGDRGSVNKGGLLSVLGRGGHSINRGDDVIYPEQLEAPIMHCPGLAGVAVTGVPDEALLEEVCVLLVRKSGGKAGLDEAAVHQFCRESIFINPEILNLVPRYYRFVDAIPTLSNGKIDRFGVKRLARRLVCGDQGCLEGTAWDCKGVSNKQLTNKDQVLFVAKK